MGGAEKALVALLQGLDYSQFQVDLLLFKKEGILLSEVPNEVTLLEAPKNYHYFDGSFKKVLKSLNPFLIYQRCRFVKLMKKGKNTSEAEQYAWGALKKALPRLNKKYDVAIGYLEKTPNYYVVDKVTATKKIGYIHNDYVSLGLNKTIDASYFDQLYAVCTISKNCHDVLHNEFPLKKNLFHLIPNFVSKEILVTKSREEINEKYWSTKSKKIISVGRLEKQKGFVLSIEVANLLKQKGIDFKWFIFGEGSLRNDLQNLINDYGLQDTFVLLGMHINPTKFMKNADLIVQTSLFEGKSIVIDESKILQKPILVTNYPTVSDQIVDNYNGIISSFDPSDIASKIEHILHDGELRQRLSQNLELETAKDEGLIKFLRLIE